MNGVIVSLIFFAFIVFIWLIIMIAGVFLLRYGLNSTPWAKFRDEIQDDFLDAYDAIYDYANLVTSGLVDAGNTTYAFITDTTNTSVASVTGTTGDSIIYMENQAAATWQYCVSGLAKTFSDIASMFSGWFTSFYRTLIHMMTLVSKGIIDAGTEITEAMKDLGDLGQKWAKDAEDALDPSKW